MKLLVLDVEGTIFKAKYKIKGTDFASTMWQPLAQKLGVAAIAAEVYTHKKWENNEYRNYIEWIEDTVAIHKFHKLHKDTFNSLIIEAEYIDGVVDFFNKLDRSKYVPVLVSGGFQELVRRAQKELSIKYGYGACEYEFDPDTGYLASHTMTPCDFIGKYDYVRALFNVYGLDPGTDWIFIGDGKNDLDIAKLAPLSFGINAHPELANEVDFNVDNFNQIYELMQKHENIIYLGSCAVITDEESDDEIDKECIYLKQIEKITKERDLLTTALRVSTEQVSNSEATLKIENHKRKLAEKAKKELIKKQKNLEAEHKERSARLESMFAENNFTESQKYLNDIKFLKNNIDIILTEKADIDSELINKRIEIEKLSINIKEKDDTIKILKARDFKLKDNYDKLTEENIELNAILAANKRTTTSNPSKLFELSIFKRLTETRENFNETWEVLKDFDARYKNTGSSMFIDCLVITRYSIIVIEAKNYFGEIKSCGDIKNDEWFSVASNGSKKTIKCTQINPYHQIQNYCSGIRSLIQDRLNNKIPVFGVILFPDEAEIFLGSEIGDYYRIGKLKDVIDIVYKINQKCKNISNGIKCHSPIDIKKVFLGRG